MDVWMISRKELKNDLLDIFSALGNLQYRYDWIVSDHDMWYSPGCPEDISNRWNWNALLISGEDLTKHLDMAYISFVFGGILSAVPLETNPEQVWNYIPGWEVNFEDPAYRFQTPLTELELICCDGYAWVIVCKPEFSGQIRKNLPQAMPPKEWYSSHNQVTYDDQGNKMTVIG